MKRLILILCLFYCPPVFADRVSDLEKQVAIQQEQILELQLQMRAIVGERGEQPIEEVAPKGTELAMRHREPRASSKFKSGYNALSYQAKTQAVQYRENTGGFGMSAELDVRVLDPLRFNLTFDGAILNDTSNSYGDLRTSNLFADTRMRLYTGSPNVKYRVFSSDRVSADMSLGYEFFGQQVRARDIRRFFTSGATSTANMENDDITGHGPRMGIVTKFHPTNRLSFGAEAFYSTFFDVKWTVTDAPNRHTEGNAFRWDLGADYAITKRLTVGGGYRGYLLHTDLTKTKLNDALSFYPEGDVRSDLFYFSVGIKY